MECFILEIQGVEIKKKQHFFSNISEEVGPMLMKLWSVFYLIRDKIHWVDKKILQPVVEIPEISTYGNL